MDIQYHIKDALTLGRFLSPILTVTTAWNTVETGDMNVTQKEKERERERERERRRTLFKNIENIYIKN